MSEDFSAMFASMTASLQRMEEKIAGVAEDVENLKNPHRAAQPPGTGSSGVVHSTPQTQSVSPPAPIHEDSLATTVLWAERMDLDSGEEADMSNNTNASNSKMGSQPVTTKFA